jgi:hypothetical protein
LVAVEDLVDARFASAAGTLRSLRPKATFSSTVMLGQIA